MFKGQKIIIQTIKKVIKKFQTFFPVKILVMNVSFRNSQKPVLECSFPALMVKTLKNTCEGVHF